MSQVSYKKTVAPTWSDVVVQANLGIHAASEKTQPRFSALSEAALSEDTDGIATAIEWAVQDQ